MSADEFKRETGFAITQFTGSELYRLGNLERWSGWDGIRARFPLAGNPTDSSGRPASTSGTIGAKSRALASGVASDRNQFESDETGPHQEPKVPRIRALGAGFAKKRGGAKFGPQNFGHLTGDDRSHRSQAEASARLLNSAFGQRRQAAALPIGLAAFRDTNHEHGQPLVCNFVENPVFAQSHAPRI